MKLFTTFCIFCLFLGSKNVFSQPGGGGGINIVHFYDKNGKEIDIFNNKSLKIRSFVLKSNKLNYETFIFEKSIAENKHLKNNNKTLFLPPYYNFDAEQAKSQRLYLNYKGEIMLIDFHHILGENGMGNIEKIDSMVIQQGHFNYNRKTKKYIEVEKRVNTDFLLEKNLPASYFLKRAAIFIEDKNAKAALADINEAIKIQNGEKNCETLILLSKVYTQMKDYEAAIASISAGMNCKYGKYSDASTNYYTRISLYIKTNQYQNALADYNALVKISEDPFFEIINRTHFKIDYLKVGCTELPKKLPRFLGKKSSGICLFFSQFYVL